MPRQAGRRVLYMIGEAKWFSPRKYTGWGVTPNCWQGWAYTLAFVLPMAIINSLSIDSNLKNILTSILIGLFLLDIFHMMTQIKKDERERLHEAIADRNALWFIIAVLIIWVVAKQNLDPIYFVAIIGAMLVKSATHFYLRDK